MTDRPILFSAPMIKALLAGTKTQTRRLAFKGGDEGQPTTWNALYQEWMFRPIDAYPDYLAGRDGLVYSLKRGVPAPLQGSPTSKGYLSVSLCRKGTIVTHSVHVIIATAWLGPRPTPEHEVRHLDGNQTNNRIDNLDWGTKTDNWSDRRSLGRGVLEEHHAAKLTLADAETIRQSTLSQRKLAKDYGVAQSTIWSIKRGEIWRPAKAATGRNFALPEAPRLWVREAWRCNGWASDVATIFYRASEGDGYTAMCEQWPVANHKPLRVETKWSPSLHLPRWASRLTLTVTDVRVQRLQEISDDDAIAEGVSRTTLHNWSADHSRPPLAGMTPVGGFYCLWTGINGEPSWAANPWVVALTFVVERRNIDAC